MLFGIVCVCCDCVGGGLHRIQRVREYGGNMTMEQYMCEQRRPPMSPTISTNSYLRLSLTLTQPSVWRSSRERATRSAKAYVGMADIAVNVLKIFTDTVKKIFKTDIL